MHHRSAVIYCSCIAFVVAIPLHHLIEHYGRSPDSLPWIAAHGSPADHDHDHGGSPRRTDDGETDSSECLICQIAQKLHQAVQMDEKSGPVCDWRPMLHTPLIVGPVSTGTRIDRTRGPPCHQSC